MNIFERILNRLLWERDHLFKYPKIFCNYNNKSLYIIWRPGRTVRCDQMERDEKAPIIMANETAYAIDKDDNVIGFKIGGVSFLWDENPEEATNEHNAKTGS